MAKRERGAARTAGRSSARIYSMEDLRRSHGRRPASERGRRLEDTGEYPRANPAFCEKDDPFGAPHKITRCKEQAGRPAPQSGAKRRCGGRNSLHLVDKPQENHENREKKHHRLLLGSVFLVIAGIAVMVGINVYKIRTIEVKGNDTVSGQSIAALSGINVGESILFANLSQAKLSIESDPQFEVLGIKTLLPDKVSIEVRERKPHAAIICLGSYIVIDEKGYVLDIRDSIPAGQYPLVTGIEIKPTEKRETITGPDQAKLVMMGDLLKALYDSKALQYLSEVHMENDGSVNLLSSAGIKIDMGKTTDLEKKAEWIASIIPELHAQGYTSGILYITGAKNPIYSVSGTQADQNSANSGVQGAGNNTDSSPGNAA
jgi:cell division protein FtsQ